MLYIAFRIYKYPLSCMFVIPAALISDIFATFLQIWTLVWRLIDATEFEILKIGLIIYAHQNLTNL